MVLLLMLLEKSRVGPERTQPLRFRVRFLHGMIVRTFPNLF